MAAQHFNHVNIKKRIKELCFLHFIAKQVDPRRSWLERLVLILLFWLCPTVTNTFCELLHMPSTVKDDILSKIENSLWPYTVRHAPSIRSTQPEKSSLAKSLEQWKISLRRRLHCYSMSGGPRIRHDVFGVRHSQQNHTYLNLLNGAGHLLKQFGNLWTNWSDILKASYQLIHCVAKGCTDWCKCKTARLQCSDLCVCGAWG